MAGDDIQTNKDDGAEFDDVLWGADEIARYIRRSKRQVYHLMRTGFFDGAVTKLNAKTLVASKRRLRELIQRIGK